MPGGQRSSYAPHCEALPDGYWTPDSSVFRPGINRRSRRSFAAGPLLLVPDARADGLFVCQIDDALTARGSENRPIDADSP
jgi:hypothetical protein